MSKEMDSAFCFIQADISIVSPNKTNFSIYDSISFLISKNNEIKTLYLFGDSSCSYFINKFKYIDSVEWISADTNFYDFNVIVTQNPTLRTFSYTIGSTKKPIDYKKERDLYFKKVQKFKVFMDTTDKLSDSLKKVKIEWWPMIYEWDREKEINRILTFE